MTFVLSIQLINFTPRQCIISKVRSWLIKRPCAMSPVLCSRLIFQDGPASVAPRGEIPLYHAKCTQPEEVYAHNGHNVCDAKETEVKC